MRDFNSWEEVREWISDVDAMETVSVEHLYFSHTYMSCGEGCCDESFDSVDFTMDMIRRYAGGDYTKVNRI